jgi:hypothetical protein
MNLWQRVAQLESWNKHLLEENNLRRQEIDLILKYLKVHRVTIPAETKFVKDNGND